MPTSSTEPATLPLPTALLAACGSGALLALGYALEPLWWAPWLAPAPVLAAALASPGERSRWLGAISGLIGGASTFGYYLQVVGAPGTLVIGIAHTLLWAGAVRFTAAATRRAPVPVAALTLPAFVAAVDTLVIAFTPHGAAGSLGNSQAELLEVAQLAAIGGIPAIVFLMMTVGSALGFLGGRLLGAPLSTLGVGTTVAAAAIMLLAALTFGQRQLMEGVSGRTINIVVAATDEFARMPPDWDTVWRAYEPQLERTAKSGDIVVLPEKTAQLSPAEIAKAQAALAAFARTHNVSIVAGIDLAGPFGQSPNRALIATADGTAYTYDKQHLVPGLEARNRPGNHDLIVTLGGIGVGIAICKDMHIPALGRSYAQGGAQLMLVPAWDFGADGWLSSRLTILRGIEDGFAIARATREGLSSISDRTGHIIAENRSSTHVQATRASISLPPAGPLTFHARFGDLFGWLCVAATILLRILPRNRALQK